VFGEATSVIDVPGANDVPSGLCITVPDPTTATLKFIFATKFAVAVVFEFSTMVHVVAPARVQVAPVQLTNEEFALGVSVSVMVVLFGNDVPVGDCVIVPGPVTLVENVNFVTVVTAVPVNVAPVSTPVGPLILSDAARPPKACGANVIVIEHDDPTAIGADVQLLVAEKSPGFEPTIVIDDTVIGSVAVAPFCNWYVSGEEEPVAVSGNRIGDGAMRIGSGISGGGATDVADIANVRVPALDSIVRVPVNVPTDVGAKFTPVEQFPCGAMGDVHWFNGVRLGSPVTVTLVIVSGP
jgi:hypothetical protein